MDNNQFQSANHIIEHLKAIQADGETLEYIINELSMADQMFKQIGMTISDLDVNNLLEERNEFHDMGKNVHIRKIATLEDVKKAHSDMLISLLSWEHFNRLYEHYSDELNYSLGVSDYLISLVGDLLNSQEYKKAEEFAVVKVEGNIYTNFGGAIWGYFEETYGECFDWFFVDKAREIIFHKYPLVKNNFSNL